MSRMGRRVFFFSVDTDSVPGDWEEKGSDHPRAKFLVPPQGVYDFSVKIGESYAEEDGGSDRTMFALAAASIMKFDGDWGKALDSPYVDPGSWPEGSSRDEEVLRSRIGWMYDNLALTDVLEFGSHLMSQLSVKEKERGESNAPAE
jgi:hypothetical protein